VRKYIGKVLAKVRLKKIGIRLYFFFTNGWTDSIAFSRRKMIPLLVRYRSRKGIYAIDLDSDWLGLGARVVKTLEILLYCEENGLQPLIRYNYREKRKAGKDYFGELFGYKLADKETLSTARFTSIKDIDELGWTESYNKKLRLEFVNSLFLKYLFIHPDIVTEVGLFCRNNFGDSKVLGVHYRGTDKAGEAPLVAETHLLEHIRAVLLENTSLEMIFLSADDEKLIMFLQRSNLPVPVIFREDAVRSKDGDQFHRKKEISKSVVNRDAIVNMLLLSHTDFLLKTASILSDCSVIFNPSIPVKVISFPHSDNLTWWPATEIKQNQEKGNYAIAEAK
jgi:hypothetical protein